MNLSSVNYWSALVAALVSFGFGFIWYSPILFGEVWMEHMNINIESINLGIVGISFVLYFVIAVVTAVFANALGCRGVGGAIVLSLWLGIGILAVNMLGGYLFLSVPWQAGLVDLAYVYLRTLIFCLFACLWVKKDTAKAKA